MKRCSSVAALRKALQPLRAAGKKIALVPTMGALHEGHLELVRRARRRCGVVVVSVFVNPLQFGPGEDLASYPRRLRADARLLEREGVALLFAPTAEKFYGPDHQTTILNSEVQSLYCGAYRPGHFAGVLTVVAKLFHAAMPDEAFFGRKDFQQAWLLQKMVADLNWPLLIRTVPIVRASDGLALSSRNAYLSVEQRAAAPAIYAALCDLRRRAEEGETSAARLLASARKSIERAGGEIQYLEIASQATLLPVRKLVAPSVVLAAVFLGKTRLIDNIEIEI